jgi:hypothetical protein
MARRPPPISLRLRNVEVNRRAHALLLRLSEDELLQRRIKWQARKALISVREMAALATPQMGKMLPSHRARWQAECKQLQSLLEKIKSRGIY